MNNSQSGRLHRRVLLVGSERLLILCGDRVLESGGEIAGVVTDDAGIAAWGEEKGLAVLDFTPDLDIRLRDFRYEYLLSIGNRRILMPSAISAASVAAINFHDGPLPRYSGLNAPNWAVFNGESHHGVTWHLMTERADAGPILLSRTFPLTPDESALTLNARCFEAGMSSFEEVLAIMAAGDLRGRVHELDPGTRHGRDDLPLGTAFLRWDEPAEKLVALARALDFGSHTNRMALPRMQVRGTPLVARRVTLADAPGDSRAGSVLRWDAQGMEVACADNSAVRLEGLQDLTGASWNPALMLEDAETVLDDTPWRDDTIAFKLLREQVAEEESWIRHLSGVRLPTIAPRDGSDGAAGSVGGTVSCTIDLPSEACEAWGALNDATAAAPCLVSLVAGFVLRRDLNILTEEQTHFDLWFSDPHLAALHQQTQGWVSGSVPLRLDAAHMNTVFDVYVFTEAALRENAARGSFAADLPLRLSSTPRDALRNGDGDRILVSTAGYPAHTGPFTPDIAFLFTPGSQTVRLLGRKSRYTDAALGELGSAFVRFVRNAAANLHQDVLGVPVHPPLPVTALVAEDATGSAAGGARNICDSIHAASARHPSSLAIAAPDATLTFAELERRVSQLAHFLDATGVGRGDRVALGLDRSAAAVIAALAVMRTGAAYVPLNPAHPAERNEFILSDSGASLLLTTSALARNRDGGVATVLLDLVAPLLTEESTTPFLSVATPDDAAYLIYTSGSTGVPKGVVVEHRNVLNLFDALDTRVPLEPGAVWLSVTPLSFDISVLELFWTLSRGAQVVIPANTIEGARLADPAARTTSMDFSLFYFSADSGTGGAESYRLLLEGARFADANGFAAVWTPERHFHAFGGLYPNPVVTAAALAAITSRVQLRAGSVVLPLHHPIRVAEDWAMVDNISNGRVGISFASGWQPNDFVLRPDAYIGNKSRLIRDMDVVRRLWRGEALPFPGPDGKDVTVRTLPRPVQPELPFWFTTAGNPDSYRIAGEQGARVLTHLLGQSTDELATKIAIYRTAWKEAGHAGDGFVTLMLHTFVDEDELYVRDTVRGPLKEYLRSSVSLIRDFAATFPALKRSPNGELPDFRSLSKSEMDDLLEYSVERYYEASGLFGSPDRCAQRVQDLGAIAVDEVAALIDFGVPTDAALDALRALARVASRFQGKSPVQRTVPPTIGETILQYRVTHMQCTPSLARLLLTEPAGANALASLQVLLVGGEALSPKLARDLRAATAAAIYNMYGPTETTVWSTVHQVREAADTVPIGTPLANTQLYVVNEFGEPLTHGGSGELWIGGLGVARGYHNRPALSRARFLPNPFAATSGSRLYRTGDRVMINAQGELEFLGRMDEQVKILGHRIELGEIEKALESHPAVAECAVAAAGGNDDGFALQGYVVPRNGEELSDDSLIQHLRQRVPDVMIPARFYRVASLQRNVNGKIDRKALLDGSAPAVTAAGEKKVASPAAPVADAAQERALPPPAATVENRVMSIWRDVLARTDIQPSDNFFDIGGQSLLALRVHARLKDEFAAPVSITDLFRYSTVRTLAAHISSLLSTPSGGSTASATVNDARARGAARREAARARRGREQ